jgi:transcriptional regulator with XRE-family HTH domain
MEVNVQRLKQLREEQALSLRELAGISEVPHSVIWRIESGRTGAQPRTIRKLAQALGVEPRELVKRSGDDA